jgi:tRNA modification GTPase
MEPDAQGQAMLLTPPGAAAIAVVRIVGPAVGDFLGKHFSRPIADGRCVHGDLRDGLNVLDDPLIVLSSAGRVADINIHGGVWVVQAILGLLRRSGFAVIEPSAGVLPTQAVEADSTLMGEVLTHLPLAKTEQALRILLAQPQAWRALLDGDVPIERIERIRLDRSLHWLLRTPKVAIVGLPNSGKSTLANCLFAQDRSITADTPGTTRDWVGEIANLDGLAVMLVDTPGLRDTTDPIEKLAIDHSGRVIESADAVVLVLDASRPMDDQRALVERFSGAVRVLNKVDRAQAWASATEGAVQTVATSGVGVDMLRVRLREVFGCGDLSDLRPRCWTRRQQELLDEARRDPALLRGILG